MSACFVNTAQRTATDATLAAAALNPQEVAHVVVVRPGEQRQALSRQSEVGAHPKVIVSREVLGGGDGDAGDVGGGGSGDNKKKTVCLLSGGGAGHEPAHAGFVGRGMLDCAVSGEIFASPGVADILAGVRACCLSNLATAAGAKPRDILLIVKNYTGDRLNFGLAAERARDEFGIESQTVFVADDVALLNQKSDNLKVGARGVAGTLFVHKVAGYFAQQGMGLDGVAEQARAVTENMASLGCSLGPCLVPGQERRPFFEQQDGEKFVLEMGLGIHGEPGVERQGSLGSVSELVQDMISRLQQALGDDSAAQDVRYAVMVNNLGGVSSTEMGVVAGEVVNQLGRRCELLVGPGAFMTALEMRGFSLTLLRLNDEFRQAIVAPVAPRFWMPAVRPGEVITVDVLDDPALGAAASGAESANDVDGEYVRARLSAVCDALQDPARVSQLNDLDRESGDGDCGTTFASLGATIASDLAAGKIPVTDRAASLTSVGRICEGIGGSSGIVLSMGLSAAAAKVRSSSGATPADLFDAFVGAVSHHGGAAEGDRTLLDAVVPAGRALREAKDPAAAARAGAEATSKMTSARAGRAAYAGSRDLSGHEDPGAMAVASIIEAWMRDA